MNDCPYCQRHGQPACRVISPRGAYGLQYYCTRPVGHEEPIHVACAYVEHNVKSWAARDGEQRLEVPG